MCRSKELGGRRCPQYTDPAKRAAYNARRRELYANRKKGQQVDYIPLDQPRHKFHESDSPEWQRYKKEAKAFKEKLSALEGWKTYKKRLHDYTDFEYINIRIFLNGYDATDIKASPMSYDQKEQKTIAKSIKVLDEVLTLADKPDEPRLLYRAMMVPFSIKDKQMEGWMKENFPVGGVVSQLSYMSTSHDPHRLINNFGGVRNQHRAIMFEIISKQGAVLGNGTSEYGSLESEVLMPREAKFKIVSVDENVDYQVFAQDENNGEGSMSSVKRTVIRLMDVDGEDS
jgi:hypothetical protein